jgi:hypothetical protein
MIIASWKISGNGFDPRQFAERFKLSTDVIANRGDRDIRGRVVRIPGCNISIPARGNSMTSLVSAINRFITRHKSAFVFLKHRGISSTIHIGVSVGSGKHFTRSVVLSNKYLSALAKLGVDLVVTGYPTSSK